MIQPRPSAGLEAWRTKQFSACHRVILAWQAGMVSMVELKLNMQYVFLSWRIGLLCIVGMLKGGGFVAVAVGDK